MAMTDPLGDMLTRIRNGAARRKSSVSTPASKLRARVLDVLQSEGYIRGYSEVEFDNGKPSATAMPEACFACHSIVKNRDFVFSRYAP